MFPREAFCVEPRPMLRELLLLEKVQLLLLRESSFCCTASCNRAAHYTLQSLMGLHSPPCSLTDAVYAAPLHNARCVDRHVYVLQTVVFLAIARLLNLKTLVIANSVELIEQTNQKLQEMWPGVCCTAPHATWQRVCGDSGLCLSYDA